MRHVISPLLFVLGCTCVVVAEGRQPNIIFILADDLGYTDVACFGSKYYETPNIDRLAAEGMRFTDGYTCGPNCQPTRAALLSGQYGPRTGVYTVGNINRFDWQSRPLRPVDNVTELPLDKDHDRRHAEEGRLRDRHVRQVAPGQRRRASSRANAALTKRSSRRACTSISRRRRKTDYPKGQYLADFLTDHAVDFIERHKDEPFFLYLPHFGVHSPHEAKQELIAQVQRQAAGGRASRSDVRGDDRQRG